MREGAEGTPARTGDTAQLLVLGSPAAGCGLGVGAGAGVPAGWASRAGRSLGKARRPYSDLRGCPPQLYNLLPQPGGRGRRTDRQVDRHTGAGRAGEAPAAMVSPRHGPTDTSLCAAKAPQGRFYGWVPGPRNPGPRPSSPRSPGVSPLAPSSWGDPGVQAGLSPRGRHSLASRVRGQSEPHLFWSLASWARQDGSLPPVRLRNPGSGRGGLGNREPSQTLWASSPLSSFSRPLVIYNDDSSDA